MRRLGVLALGPGLLFSPALSAGLALPEPTCSYPEPSFGVLMDEDAIAAGALDEIYVDGVMAVPILLGLGLASVQSPEELVARGLVNMDVVTEDGSAPGGTLEIALVPFQNGSIMGGYPAWLIWTGTEPFAPNSDYSLEFSFLNDTLSDCPEAVSSSGTRVFRTGARSAAEDLVPPKFVGAALMAGYVPEPGCCSIPETDACMTDGNCVACWQSYTQIATAEAVVESPLPIGYFSIAVSLEGGDPAPIVNQSLVYATFSVTEPAAEYCFEASLRPRAGGDANASVTKCVPSTEFVRAELAPNTMELPAEACAAGPLAERADQGVFALAAVAATEAEARALVEPPVATPGMPLPAQPTPSSPALTPSNGASGSSDGCAMSRGAGSSVSVGFALLGLLGLVARLRGPRRRAS